jgi:D-alanyl-D-alanine carboxypeptidase
MRSSDASTPPADDLSSVLEPIRATASYPALAAAVYEGETLLAIGAVGARAAGDPTPVTVDDRWHLGSCTKAMTATLLALYAEAGELSFDTTLAEAFPGIAPEMDPAFRPITLAEVLMHRGGVDPEHSWIGAYGSDSRALDVQRLELAETLLTAPPTIAPGTYAYSNAGYILVGAAIEQRAGDTWEALMTERIFAPLGMTSCGFGPPGTPGVIDEPRGHRSTPPIPIEPDASGADNAPILGPAGRVHCTLADWSRFVALHLAGARGEATALLDPETFTRLHTPWPGGTYALGWGAVERPWAGGIALTHSGSNTMWYVVTWIAPERDRFVLVAANHADDGAGVTDQVVTELIARYFP